MNTLQIKLILIFFLLGIQGLLGNSNFAVVQGHVMNGETSSPMQNQAMTISVDSMLNDTHIYELIVYTDSNGFYRDTLFFPGTNLQGTIRILTLDPCFNTIVNKSALYKPDIQLYQFDFTLCDSLEDCHADFTYYPDTTSGINNKIHFQDISQGNPDHWSWDFGDGHTSAQQNPVHVYQQPGSYETCLTIHNSITNCTDSFCQTVTTPVFLLLGGFAYSGIQPINNPLPEGDTGIAVLYRKVNQSLIPVDTNWFSDWGYYWFTGVSPGTYAIQVSLTKNSTHYFDLLPTYFPNSILWESAGLITMNDTHSYSMDTHLATPNPNFAGPGAISGTVQHVTGPPPENNPDFTSVTVILFNSTNEPIDYVQTDPSGYFSFRNLSLGFYRLKADLAGKYSQWTDINLSDTQPIAGTVVLELYDENVFGTEEISPYQLRVNVFPNPFRDYLNILIDKANKGYIYISFTDILGRDVLNQKFNCIEDNVSITVKTDHLKNGIYFLHLTNDHGEIVYTGKLFK